MDATFWPIHTTTLGTFAIVQQFGGQATELRTLFGFKTKRGNRCAVLSKVDDEVLALIDNHYLAVFILTVYNNYAILIFVFVLYFRIDVCAFRVECPLIDVIDLRATVGNDNTFIFLAYGGY